MVKTLKISTKVCAILAMLLMMLLVSQALMLGSSALVKESKYATPLSPTKDYGNLLQYDWDQAGADEGNTGSSGGPAPDRPNILWQRTVSGSGMISAFDGKIFTASGTT